MPNFTVKDLTTGTLSTDTDGTPNAVSVSNLAGQPLTNDYVNITPDSLNVKSNVPNVFIRTGPGGDTIDLTAGNGDNYIDPGAGVNDVLLGSGRDAVVTVAQALQAATTDIIHNFHNGDVATLYGITPGSFSAVFNPNGAFGPELDLTNHNAAGLPITLDLLNPSASPISVAFGTDQTFGPYMFVSA